MPTEKNDRVRVGTLKDWNINAVLIILTKVEMPREPSLDAPMLTDEFNKFLALFFVGMVQPTTAIDDMVFL